MGVALVGSMQSSVDSDSIASCDENFRSFSEKKAADISWNEKIVDRTRSGQAFYK